MISIVVGLILLVVITYFFIKLLLPIMHKLDDNYKDK